MYCGCRATAFGYKTTAETRKTSERAITIAERFVRRSNIIIIIIILCSRSVVRFSSESLGKATRNLSRTRRNTHKFNRVKQDWKRKKKRHKDKPRFVCRGSLQGIQCPAETVLFVVYYNATVTAPRYFFGKINRVVGRAYTSCA